MFLKLADKSYIKKSPYLNSYMPYLNHTRNSIVVNGTASDILELCNGSNTAEDIIGKLKKKYNEKHETVKNYVDEFLAPLVKQGFIEHSPAPQKISVTRGSSTILFPDIFCW